MGQSRPFASLSGVTSMRGPAADAMLANVSTPESSSGGHRLTIIMGSGCGTTHAQIEAIAEAVASYAPRAIPVIEPRLPLAAVE
jgi:hypothetical protein